MLLIFESSMNKNKGHSKIECPLHWCGKWDLNPHANTDWGTWGLRWVCLRKRQAFPLPPNQRFGAAEQVPLPQNQRFRAIPVWIFSMIMLC